MLVLGVEGFVTGFSSESFGFGMKEFSRVSLTEEKKSRELDEGIGDGCGIKGPAPGCILGNETTSNGPYRGTE